MRISPLASIRTFTLMVCIVAVVAIAGGADDSISVLRRKDTGFRLLPGTSSPEAPVHPDLSLRLQLQDHPWLQWDRSKLSNGSYPYGGSTANWIDYFSANRHTGEDPNRKGNSRWIEGR